MGHGSNGYVNSIFLLCLILLIFRNLRWQGSLQVTNRKVLPFQSNFIHLTCNHLNHGIRSIACSFRRTAPKTSGLKSFSLQQCWNWSIEAWIKNKSYWVSTPEQPSWVTDF